MANQIQALNFLQQQLQIYSKRFYKTIYPNLWAVSDDIAVRNHVATPDLPLGAKQLISSRIDGVGKGTIYSGKATDIPLANVGIAEDAFKTRIIIMGAEWNLFELEAQMLANQSPLMPQRDIVQEYLAAMKKGLDERHHELAVFGDVDHQMQGLFTSSALNMVVLTQNLFTLTDAGAIYDFFLGLLSDFQKTTKLTGSATKILCTTDLYNRVFLKRFSQSNQGGGNVFELLTNPDKGLMLTKIVKINELEASYLEQYGVFPGGTGKDMMIVCQDDPETVQDGLIVPTAFRRRFYPTYVTPVRLSTEDGITYRTTGWCATSEVEAQPLKAVYYAMPKYA